MSCTASTPPAPTYPCGCLISDTDTTHHRLLPGVLHLQKMVPQTSWGSPLCKEVRASRILTKVLDRVTHQQSEGVDCPPSPAVSKGSRDQSCSCAQSITSCRSRQSGSAQSQVTDNDQETSSKSEPSHEEEDAPCKDEDAEAGKGEVEVLSNGQVVSDGKEGQGHPQIQNALTGISHIFSTHEETDAKSDPREKIQSVQWTRCQPSPKEDIPSKDLSGSSSEEEQPTDEGLHDKARQRAQQLDTNFDAWWCRKIAKGIAGWAMRDTMICDFPEHGKVQPNHPDPVGLPWTTWASARSSTVSGLTSMTCAGSTSWG